MGGMIFSVGPESLKQYEKLKETFIELKNLPMSHEDINVSFQLLKFRRMYDEDDFNLYHSHDVTICAVGTVYYKNSGPKDSVNEIALDVTRGSTLSDIAKLCDGHFCIIALSKKDSMAHIITDHAGSLHLYLYNNNDLFMVSTSMLAIARHFKVTPNIRSLRHFLSLSHCLQGATVFEEIEILRPASIYSIDLNRGCWNKKEYWWTPRNSNYDQTFDDAVKKIKNALEGILSKIQNENAIYDFTGGYDSRFILALAYGMSKSINRLSGFFFGPLDSREARIVEKNCHNLGINYVNYELPLEWEDNFFDYSIRSHRLCDGMENAFNYAPILWVMEKKKKYFSYSINGLAGELYRQKEWEYDFGRRGKNRPANLKRKIKMELFGPDFTFSIFTPHFKKSMIDLPSELIEIYSKTNETLDADAPNTLHYDNLYFEHRLRYCHGRNISTSNQIIQTISPLWFKKPIQISLSLPYYFKLKSKLTRHIAEIASRRFANEKMINGTPFVSIRLTNLYRFLPGAIFVLRKIIRKASQVIFKKTIWSGLTTPDYDSNLWFQKALMDGRCKSLVNYDEMITASLYDRIQFKNFVQKATEDNFHYYSQLGDIMTLELTMRYCRADKASFNLD